MKGIILKIILLFCVLSLTAGCAGLDGNRGDTTYQFPVIEAEWIRNGEPLEYEGEFWYPQDNVDVLLDSEVMLLGKYRDVEFFAQTVDVRPYNRLYTKFGSNRFRSFENKVYDDQSYQAQ